MVADARQGRPSAVSPVDKDVRSVWEQAIAAKGGRARLHAIRNFVITSETKLSNSPRPEVATREYIERLTVLPNRFWQFADYRPGLMGTQGLMLDLARRQVWDSNRRPAPLMLEDLTHSLHESQFLYFLETSSLVPELIRLTASTVDGVRVDVVETQTAGERVDFSFAQDSHLPVRVTAYQKRYTAPNPLARRDYRTRDYRVQDGIQMPRRLYFSSDSDVTVSYRFNVDYDPAIFDPKMMRFEVRAWMPQ